MGYDTLCAGHVGSGARKQNSVQIYVKLTCNVSSTYLVHTITYIHVPFNKSCTSMYRYVLVCTRDVRVCTKYPDLVQPVTIPDEPAGCLYWVAAVTIRELLVSVKLACQRET